jgi:lysine-specific demethylase 3
MLHLDISDAVNTCCHVSIPKTAKGEAGLERDTMKIIQKGGCDQKMLARCKEKDIRIGALWHIFDARDADKIRDFLNKLDHEDPEVAEDAKPTLETDPIHDQVWYLDDERRQRLKDEYAVEGYAIIQCLGDSVFIPAGAPHQVLNLNSCIKVAGDFVSPENVAHCFNLTEQFRRLSDQHANHPDKLQIKSNVFHSVKDSCSAIMTADKAKLKGTDRNDDTD